MYYCKHCKHGFTTHNHMIMHERECPYKGMESGYKICKSCGNIIILSRFNMDNTRYDNLNSQCKDCTRQYRNRWATDFSNVPIGSI